ncbi:MAG TPA: rRNA maturation RNase YbeY [Planctomycetes bacterium]|nr:rRNA maturation RNase YbeY [Planctomycetota bacterium]
MIEVTWDLDDAERPLGEEDVVGAVEEALRFGGREGASLSIVFVDDATLATLHDEHLGDPTETDVITFDLGEGEGPVGELYVSVERARRLAHRRGVSVARELSLYLVHGALHLCGFDDGTGEERARMRAAEAKVLSALGFPSDDLDHEYGLD